MRRTSVQLQATGLVPVVIDVRIGHKEKLHIKDLLASFTEARMNEMIKGRILVVENEIFLLEGIREVLERENYEVLIAQNGIEGLALLENGDWRPDLILSDIMMPGMDGYQFLDVVRSEPRWVDIPFIFMTAKTERRDQNLARLKGVDDYLPKPFQMDELVLTVDSKLKRHSELRNFHTAELRDLKSNIMTILHHELRTPLTYVIGYSELLQGNADMDPSQFRNLMLKIDKGAQRLRNLIENFIMLVELQTDTAAANFELNTVVMHYHDTFRHLIDNYHEIARAENMEFIAEIDPATPPILSNSGYLVKVMDCLLDNAIKFSSPGNTVIFRVRPFVNSQGYQFAAFHVIDEGIGISEEALPKIFDPFFQAIRRQQEHPGTGSGLAIAQGLVELHKGKILVKSELDQGSHFSVIIPAYQFE
jgi:two-component system sensor kinase